jgi:hypothetical protein
MTRDSCMWTEPPVWDATGERDGCDWNSSRNLMPGKTCNGSAGVDDVAQADKVVGGRARHPKNKYRDVVRSTEYPILRTRHITQRQWLVVLRTY